MGLPGNGAIDRGFCRRRELLVAQPTRGAQSWKESAQRTRAQTPPEACVYDKLPFVQSDVSALEITLLVLKEGPWSHDLHR